MRTAAICPTCATYTNAVCVIYDGPYLSNLDINPMSSLDDALQQINFIVGGLEKTANKSINIIADQASNVKYPSVKAVYSWATSTFEPALGFTPENVANKSTNTSLGTSNTLYPTQNAVKVYVDSAISAIPTPTLQQVLNAGNTASGEDIILTNGYFKTNIGVRVLDGFFSSDWLLTTNSQSGVGATGTFQIFQLSSPSAPFFELGSGRQRLYASSVGNPYVELNTNNITANRGIQYPNASGTFVLSVNGTAPNTSGNVTIPYPNKVYVAVISMVDGSIINLLKNTLGDTLTWVASPGTIVASSAVLANENNTFVSVTSGSTVPKIVSTSIAVSPVSWNVFIYQTDNAGVPNSTDSVYVEIRVY